MIKNEKKSGKKFIAVLAGVVFLILGSFVFHISTKISDEMSQSAVSNLNESLELIKDTVEIVFNNEAEYQKLIAEELAVMEDPEEFIRHYKSSSLIIRLSLVFTGDEQGISSTGEPFFPGTLDFPAEKTVAGLPVSTAYINSMGTWAYTIKCPVKQDGTEIAVLYAEYIYDALADVLPDKFYNGNAVLYVMDTKSERLIVKPGGIGEREAGHVNLEDFYRANEISEKAVQEEVAESFRNGRNIMFYHQVRKQESLIYMWSVNGGMLYLIGYVPVQAIQKEGDAVNQNIHSVIFVTLAAFFICYAMLFFHNRQQNRLRREQEAERELHSQQLAEALHAAQIASISKTTFLSNMSHDIRTPMNAILGFTTLLARDADNAAKVLEYTKKITASGQHLLSLINDILDVSKIESGKAVLTIGQFMLNDVVSSVDAIIRPAARDKKQNFQISVSGIRHECLIGDETRLNQILINLLSNAVKYTPEGGTIWFRIIGLEQRSSQYEHIRIEVEDNGFGMTPEYLNIIFDAFTRAENSTTNKVQGTGLGMAITKNIVELMGGTIDVVSEVDKGTLFTVELELRISDLEADSTFWNHYGISRILVVDDDEDALVSIRSRMECTKVLVDTCPSGEEAVLTAEKARESGESYDLVLLDLEMPGMDGIATAAKLREHIPEHIPIVLLTACDWEGIEKQAAQAGIDAFLSKPLFVSALKEKILEIYAVNAEEPAEENSAGLEGMHFLVAEDNEINAEILSELLALEGADCEIVSNGQLAVERFNRSEAGEFTAVLMDVQMPVMNGYEATRSIRALEREDAGTIPIIAMTANAFAEDVKDAIHAGMNAHVAKPVDMEVLTQTIKNMIMAGK